MNPPEVVIVLKTWQGRSREIAEKRLEGLAKTVTSLEENLIYPNLSWQLADDGSDEWYMEAALDILGDRPWTWSNSEADGDVGRNLNCGLRAAFSRAEIVLNWSDDIQLVHPMDITPYVNLLRCDLSVGYVQTRPIHPSLCTSLVERHGREWLVLKKWSANAFLIVTSLTLMHKRAWDFYGPYPEGLRIDIMQEEMAWRYRRFENGLHMVVPKELVNTSRVHYGGDSTWDWQLRESPEWYRYRSYSARKQHE